MKGWTLARDFIVEFFATNNRSTYLQKYGLEVPNGLFAGPVHLNVKEIHQNMRKKNWSIMTN